MKFMHHIYNQWPGLFSDTNWTDFTFVEVSCEHEAQLGGFEVALGLLGITIRITLVYDEAKRQAFIDSLLAMRDEMLNGKEHAP